MPTKLMNLLSDEQLAQVSYGKQWAFHGGIHPQENKQQSNQQPIVDSGIPPLLIFPVESRGHIPDILVKVGDSVLKGQALTKVYGSMVVQHASSSGVVVAIEKRIDLHPSGLPALSIIIETDGLDQSVTYKTKQNFREHPLEQLIEQVQQAGIVGMGGAGFPSHIKLAHSQSIKLLIINAAECEPYITADDRLMQEYSHEIIQGIDVLCHMLQPQVVVLAIEDNKPEAIAALKLALNNTQQTLNTKLIIRVIPTRYPSGSEKQLIEIITGQQTPAGKHPTDLGIVMYNVGTVFAIKQAIIDDKPVTSRIVTLTGDAFPEKGNVNVLIGTPIQYLLDKYKLDRAHLQKLIIGGPMMGFTISDGDVPVSKICNCILAPTIKEIPEAGRELACIRCGECAEVCPATLLPQQLVWYAKSQDHDKLDEYNLSSCIECGACAFVCPSDIPLVEYYRIAKSEIRNAREEAKKAEVARIRHENRAARLEQAKLDRQAKHKLAAEKRKTQLKDKNGGQDLIAAALERAKARKQALAESSQDDTEQVTNTDEKKSTVAVAIARAKAKKQAAAQNSEQTLSTATTDSSEDHKKAAVAAAIARAKAKKQAAAQ
ncbi:MAG: electron transport complex subunit RsxC, partial [Psychromonas sp.]